MKNIDSTILFDHKRQGMENMLKSMPKVSYITFDHSGVTFKTDFHLIAFQNSIAR